MAMQSTDTYNDMAIEPSENGFAMAMQSTDTYNDMGRHERAAAEHHAAASTAA